MNYEKAWKHFDEFLNQKWQWYKESDYEVLSMAFGNVAYAMAEPNRPESKKDVEVYDYVIHDYLDNTHWEFYEKLLEDMKNDKL